jgi:hypothetical protein
MHNLLTVETTESTFCHLCSNPDEDQDLFVSKRNASVTTGQRQTVSIAQSNMH